MSRDEVEDQQSDGHGEEDAELESYAPCPQQLAHVRLLDREMAEGCGLGLVEQEDEQRVERVQGREEKVGRDVERDEELVGRVEQKRDQFMCEEP